VLATFNASFHTFAPNKIEFDGLLAAKRDGRLDDAFVVAAKTNGGGLPTYCHEIDAAQMENLLQGYAPRSGRFGDFYTLSDHVFPALADAPF
jgi:hypothetical protein